MYVVHLSIYTSITGNATVCNFMVIFHVTYMASSSFFIGKEGNNFSAHRCAKVLGFICINQICNCKLCGTEKL